MTRARTPLLLVLLLVGAVAVVPSAGAQVPDPSDALLDCAGPVDDADLEGPGYLAVELANVACTEQRHADQLLHPVTASPLDTPLPAFADAYREPERHDGTRFRYDLVEIDGLTAEVYRPCAPGSCPQLPDALTPVAPPYPVVVTLHGGASNRTLHWWSSQSLAEAGYLVVAFDADGIAPTAEEATAVLDWLERGEHPTAADADVSRTGLAGHSAGGVLANALGQTDPRVQATVLWDRAQSTALDPDGPLRTPTLSFAADYLCQQSPLCQPEPYLERPDPAGPGNKARDAAVLADVGVDAMFLPLRASLHLDWTMSEPSGNRYAEAVTVHHTIAWFDRYLIGPQDPARARDAFARLTAASFDDTADRHNLSQGTYDPVAALTAGDPFAGNVPYAIAGMPVADRLSFHFRSTCHLTDPDTGRVHRSDDVRAEGCGAATASVAPRTPPRPPAAEPGGGGRPSSSGRTDRTATASAGRPLPATGGGPALVGAALVLVAARRSTRDT